MIHSIRSRMKSHWFLTLLLVPCLLRAHSVQAQNLTPDQSLQRMAVAEGFRAQLVAAEPMVRQPVSMEFDERGRLWVLQYLQYPNPEGLKRVQVDRFSRTRYDREPEPPPRGPKGADRLTILEDTDLDGRMDLAKDFLTSLNLASGFAIGRGGVFVLQAPYLLFYRDKNHDDVPDADPEVIVKGFGLDDASSVANSLTWGPDGWLYGLQGSTVTATINGITFQQGLWRVHPTNHLFELVADGGGNMWGLDFDRFGEAIASTNVGGFVGLHLAPGGSYWKQFEKHGPLRNPHAYGYFDHMPHANFQGGHVTTGGLFADCGAVPRPIRGAFVAANLLGHTVDWHVMEQQGSTYRTRHGGTLLDARDRWFAPTDLTLGPNGSIYVADWHDQRTAHPDPDANWDRSNGRIYALHPKNAQPIERLDPTRLSSSQLIEWLGQDDAWKRRTARRLLIDRDDGSSIKQLRALVLANTDPLATVEAFWTWISLRRPGEADTLLALRHPRPEIRGWIIRALANDGELTSQPVSDELRKLASEEPDVRVRSVLAQSARRWPNSIGVSIAITSIQRDIDRDDPRIPLQNWWAIEAALPTQREGVIWLSQREPTEVSKMYQSQILPRLIRRLLADQTAASDGQAVDLLRRSIHRDSRLFSQVVRSLLDANLTARVARAPGGSPFLDLLLEKSHEHQDDLDLLRLLVGLGEPSAIDRALGLARESRRGEAVRVELLRSLARSARTSDIPTLLALAQGDEPQTVRLAAAATLERLEDPRITNAWIMLLSQEDSPLARVCLAQLLARREPARALVNAIQAGKIPLARVSIEQARALAEFGGDDPMLGQTVAELWGRFTKTTPEEKLAEVRRLNNDLRAASGDLARGKELFTKHCAGCHLFQGEGGKLGPDLTFANRSDRDFLLVSLVDPSGVVRKEYQAVTIATTDGRVLTGRIIERQGDSLIVETSDQRKTPLKASEIEMVKESEASLMPEDLHRKLSPGELRDLFRFLQSPEPTPTPKPKPKPVPR